MPELAVSLGARSFSRPLICFPYLQQHYLQDGGLRWELAAARRKRLGWVDVFAAQFVSLAARISPGLCCWWRWGLV